MTFNQSRREALLTARQRLARTSHATLVNGTSLHLSFVVGEIDGTGSSRFFAKYSEF